MRNKVPVISCRQASDPALKTDLKLLKSLKNLLIQISKTFLDSRYSLQLLS